MKILIVEDEQKVSDLIKKVLLENGYDCDVAYDGTMGKRLAVNNEYDVMILDLILPGINGIDLCRIIREEQVRTPVLMLTALDTTEDIVTGLDSGANDYLTKPFSLEEFLARIRALGRIKQPVEDIVYQFNGLEINTATREARRDGNLVELTAKEFSLLELLMKNKGRVLSKSRIIEVIWGTDYDYDSNIVEVYINFLRSKIDKKYPVKLIHTMKGMGYVLKVK
ncbi:response regulator transcription factor [Cytophagaceae bacterium ABcell3]|nr:response regulator transcription factor [Cytophagaceae bacterium ABcell3]